MPWHSEDLKGELKEALNAHYRYCNLFYEDLKGELKVIKLAQTLAGGLGNLGRISKEN